MNTVCIIPARGGSKRIPRKNIRDFHGKPIIWYSITTAIQSGLFDRVIVSIDDDKIAEIAERFGAEVPFRRSESTSNDFAGIAEVLLEVVRELNTLDDYEVDVISCIYPTAPLVKADDLNSSYHLLTKDVPAVIAITQYSYPVQRAVRLDGDELSMMFPEYYTARSQDLEPVYHDSGQFFWIRYSYLLDEKKIFIKGAKGYRLPESRVQDIDTEEDWTIAELKYSMMVNA